MLYTTRRSVALATVLAAGLAVAAPAARADNFDQAVLADSPLAYFPLTTTTQGSLIDGYTTTFNSSATTTAPGGGAPIVSDPGSVGAAFNGTPDPSGYGSGPSITTSLSLPSLTTGTIIGWFDLAALPNTAGLSPIEYVAGASQGGNDLDLQIENDNGVAELKFYTNGGGSIDTPVSLDQYDFFAATFDQSSNAVDLYLNGALVASGTGAGGPKSTQFTIGDSEVFSRRNFDGSIDDVGVFGNALSATQISGLYQASLTPAAGAAVPEASPAALLALGLLPLGGLALRARRRPAAA